MKDQSSKLQAPVLSLRDASVVIGPLVIFKKAHITISKKDRICLVGRNGAGKSTLLRALAGCIYLDDGERFVQPGCRVEYLSQTPDFAEFETVWDYVSNRSTEVQFNLKDYEVESIISSLDLDGRRLVATLSGGETRRAAIARALISKPDVLLLDEPTNHLDLPTIEWLEQELKRFNGGLLIVSHDRAFLRNLSEKTYWIDRTNVHQQDMGFTNFSNWSEKVLQDEELQYKQLNKKISRETVWLREGLTARRKRNMGRVRQLQELRRQKMERIGHLDQIKVVGKETVRSGQLVLEAKKITKRFDDVKGNKLTIANKFSTIISRGERVGLIGKNGSGKTTVLRMLIGKEKPDAGFVKCGVGVEPAYFDQNREVLDLDSTLWKTLCPSGEDMVRIGGRSKHVISYLRDFLFDSQQATSPVHSLSGGERNRLLLARLFSQDHNLLVLDEPTNDLDVETLEVLEDVLANYDGTVLLVSHDRDFLDSVVTSTIAIEGDGVIQEYPGGYSTYAAQKNPKDTFIHLNGSSHKKKSKTFSRQKNKKKLSYKEQRELDQLPDLIETLEREIETLTRKLSDPELYKHDKTYFETASVSLAKKTDDLTQAENRWLALENQKQDLETQDV